MKLIQAKLRGTGSLIESNWFELSARLNQFHFPLSENGTIFLRSLQTLHPPFSCKEKDLFSELPHYEKKGTHTRHIQPAKRTIALGVFGATAELVKELGLLDDNLYETDRIEIGRRLDYSRWLNFVELSSSTRWKEIETDIGQLLLPLQQSDPKRYNDAISTTESLKGSDRVKDDLAEKLRFFLQNLEDQQEYNDLLEETVTFINRDTHFQTAREVVLKRLPLLIYFNNQGDIAAPVSMNHQSHTEVMHQELIQLNKQIGGDLSFHKSPFKNHNLSVLEKLESGIRLSLILSSELKRMNPIFLFDTPEINTPSAEHPNLRQLIKETAQSQQCIYLSASKDFFEPTDTGKNYRSSELELTCD